MTRDSELTQLERYTASAREASSKVIRAYSTSFGLASRMLDAPTRQAISDIYALVRVADEIVDGTAAAAGLDRAAQERALDYYQHETERALRIGFSTDLVVHAFATTAREVGITDKLTRPFFKSMRRDLNPSALRADEVADYIYGSAEVVGLMCLEVFLHGEAVTEEQRQTMITGARHLGAAFQKVNFLRDLSADVDGLQRNYFPWIDPRSLNERQRDEIVVDITNDLRVARESIPLLPLAVRVGVLSATNLFAALTRKVSRTRPERLITERIRVNNVHKCWIVLSALVKARLMGGSR